MFALASRGSLFSCRLLDTANSSFASRMSKFKLHHAWSALCLIALALIVVNEVLAAPTNGFWEADPNRIWKNGTGTYKNHSLIEMKTINCEDDEIVCEDLRRCVSRKLWCDGEQDCIDNSDEKNCESRCPGEQFKCFNGRCIEKDWVCDTFDDCGDNSDERSCLDSGAAPCAITEYRCRKGVCVPQTWVCDGTPDCPHGDDEDRCDNSTRRWYGTTGGWNRRGFTRRPLDYRRDKYLRNRGGYGSDRYDEYITARGYGDHYRTDSRTGPDYQRGAQYRTGGNYRPGVGGYDRDYGYDRRRFGGGSTQPVLGGERVTWSDYGPGAGRSTEQEGEVKDGQGGDGATEKTRGYDDREDHTQRPWGREYTDSMSMLRTGYGGTNRDEYGRDYSRGYGSAYGRDRTTAYGGYDPYGDPYERDYRRPRGYPTSSDEFYGPDHTEYARRNYNGRDYLEPVQRAYGPELGYGTGYHIDEFGNRVYVDGYDDYGRRYSSPYQRPMEQYGYTHPYRSANENETSETWRYSVYPDHSRGWDRDGNNTYNYQRTTFTTSVAAGLKSAAMYTPWDRRNISSVPLANKTTGETFYDRIVGHNRASRATTESYGTPSLFALPTSGSPKKGAEQQLFTFKGTTRVTPGPGTGSGSGSGTGSGNFNRDRFGSEDTEEESLLLEAEHGRGQSYNRASSPAIALSCTSEQFKCRDGYRCIMKAQRCDGKLDCVDHSDEKDCDGDDVCRYGLFRCVAGKCIISSFLCNSTNWAGRRVAVQATDFQGYM